jgi:hypothetical protein
MGFVKKMFSELFLCTCIEKTKKKTKTEEDVSSDEEYRNPDIKYYGSFDEENPESFYYESHV